MKKQNKLYLIIYTSRGQWELGRGYMVISSKDKKEAKKLAYKQIGGYDILTCNLIKPGKTKIMFYQDPIIE